MASASSLQNNEIPVPKKESIENRGDSFSIPKVIPKPSNSKSFLFLFHLSAFLHFFPRSKSENPSIIPSLMEKRKLGFFFLLSVIFSFGLLSFISCIIAETKRAKRRDLKLDGKLCFLPESQAAAFGITALICLSLAELTGNLILFISCCSSRKGKGIIKPIIPVTLLLFSWISFGLAVILIRVATSMSRVQQYGEGWLDGECYMVKDGVYVGAGVLSLAAVFSLIGAAAVPSTSTRRNRSEQGRKVLPKMHKVDIKIERKQ